MLFLFSVLSKTCGCGRLQRYSQAVEAVKTKTWQLHSAVCLQRYPVITTPPNEIEQKYQDYLNETEINQSLLSNHELDVIKEKLVPFSYIISVFKINYFNNHYSYLVSICSIFICILQTGHKSTWFG